MSYQGYLHFGDRGPIIGEWPAPIVKAPRPLEPGDRVVIENGIIRRAKLGEYGPKLPDGARIAGEANHLLEVPEWWWFLHFAERLRVEPPTECCGEGLALTGGASREPCADCPLESVNVADRSVVPCYRGVRCKWPACAEDCDGRPGR